ncbi:MAG TPA: glycosyl hydrolase family 65 protein [Euzebyales bacterium]|nr:glycosyl hydrolase family 65 protein [Euzebyales bacterium]
MLRDRIQAACRAGVHVGIFSDASARVVDDDLATRPDGPGTLHLLTDGGVGVHACGPDGLRRSTVVPEDPGGAGGAMAAAARWMAAVLAHCGIGAGLVLVVGARLASLVRPDAAGVCAVPELARATVVAADPAWHRTGAVAGPPQLCDLIDGQLRRRADGRVPDIDADPSWTLALRVPDHPADAAVQATLLTLADGSFGSRGCLEEDAPGSGAVVAAGVYTDSGDRRILLPGPAWTAFDGVTSRAGRRVLDLRTGVLLRESDDGFRSMRFASGVRPGVMVMRAEAAAGLSPGDALRPRDGGWADDCTATARANRGGGVVAAARQTQAAGALTRIERLAGYVAHPTRRPRSADAQEVLEDAAAAGFDVLLAEQRAAWARRWSDAAITIDGDPDAQLAARFALFHLLSTVADGGEAAVGARGLSGPAYDGHVFWDADVFVLPVLAATHPSAAQAMLRYRVARLDASRRRAAALGFVGALWPWESADDGDDVTPRATFDRSGTLVPIRTGAAEQHVVADIAWAVMHYAGWTGDDAFLEGPGMPLVTEGARFWASRVDHDDDGRAHVRDVIGPDEYHELVDDNAFTNVMARWHLRAAAALAERYGVASPAEARRWREVADALVDNHDPRTGRYEQFAGFYGLTPLIISDIAHPPVAADLLLGRDVVHASQVVKQADVLMLHHLLPDEVAPGSLRPNLDYYAPRTAHGSSLSPAIHAALWARAGRPDRALDLLRVALRLDLDDMTGTTAGGLHVATFGGVWQALVFGFLGLRPAGAALLLDPVLPATWNSLEVMLRFRGGRVVVRAHHHHVHVACERPVSVRLGPDRHGVTVAPPGRELPLPGRTEGIA